MSQSFSLSLFDHIFVTLGFQLGAFPAELCTTLVGLKELFLHKNQVSVCLWAPRLLRIHSSACVFAYTHFCCPVAHQIKELPMEIGALTALEVLSIAGNQIAAIPPSVGALASLREAYFGGNPVRTATKSQACALPALISHFHVCL